MNVEPWNDDKHHRCPRCHAITDPEHVSRWAVVTCCRCGTNFSRFPRLAWILPKRGVVCDQHKAGAAR